MKTNEICTAATVRQWLVKQIPTKGDFKFTVMDATEALHADRKIGKQISAALSKLAIKDIIKTVGRYVPKEGDNPSSTRAYVYQADHTTIDLIKNYAVRRKPKEYERVPINPPKKSERPRPPLLGEDAYGRAETNIPIKVYEYKEPIKEVKAESIAPQIVDELLNISISLETDGPSRDCGLRLLRIAERIFKESK